MTTQIKSPLSADRKPVRTVNDWSECEAGEIVRYRGKLCRMIERGRNKSAAGELTPVRVYEYEYLHRGVDIDGFMKATLRRDDGREVTVSLKRLRQLRREGRMTRDCYPIGYASSSDSGASR
jgi:hypothetical protein